MHGNSFRCPAVMVTAAVIGGATLLAVAYYYWSRPKKSSCCRGGAATRSVSLAPPTGGSDGSMSIDGRAGAGADVAQVDHMFGFEDEHVRQVCEKLFLEQMQLGEEMMEEEKTFEVGAIHIANAIALTGESQRLLKVLRGSLPPAHYVCIQKWLPSADVRVNQLLQEELSLETIEHIFG